MPEPHSSHDIIFDRFKRDMLTGLPALDALPEAGWVFMPWCHGQGLASDDGGYAPMRTSPST